MSSVEKTRFLWGKHEFCGKNTSSVGKTPSSVGKTRVLWEKHEVCEKNISSVEKTSVLWKSILNYAWFVVLIVVSEGNIIQWGKMFTLKSEVVSHPW
jgi:hypothetical protein